MSSVLKTIRLDFHVIRSSIKFLVAVAYLIALVIGIFAKTTYMMPIIVMLITAVASGWFFSVYEKDHLNHLYGILPIGRTQVVIGRYLYALIFAVVNEIAAGILTYVFAFLIYKNLTWLEFSVCLSVGFAYYCFVISIVYPLYIRFGYSKVYIVSNLPLYLVFVGGMLLFRNISKTTDLTKTLADIIRYFTNAPAMVWVLGVGGGLVLVSLSFLSAVMLFRKAEM